MGGTAKVSGVSGHLQGSPPAALWTQHVSGLSDQPAGPLHGLTFPLPGLQGGLWTGRGVAEELCLGQHRRGLQVDQEQEGMC